MAFCRNISVRGGNDKAVYIGDLHIHTCLSPCGELDMTPKRIIDRASDRGLDIIAIADHNSAENLSASMEVARRSNVTVTVLPAMEITSSEEVHVLAIFGTIEEAMKMQEIVYKGLTGGENDERLWGPQVIVNEDDEVVGFNKRLLIGATLFPLKALVNEIHEAGGLAIASHVDRGHFSVISQLGFIPEDTGFDALEIIAPERAGTIIGQCGGIPWVTFSDAHRLDDIGKRTTMFLLEEASFREIAMALGKIDGRMVLQG